MNKREHSSRAGLRGWEYYCESFAYIDQLDSINPNLW